MTDAPDLIAPQPGVMSISAYVGGESKAPGANRVIKLSSNENPLGPSPRAVEAHRQVSGSLARYPDGAAGALRRAIADAHGLDSAGIVCGAGSDEIISLLCQAYAGPGDEVLYSQHGFLMYKISALGAGATPVVAPERDLTADVDALLAAVTPRTRLVFLANPNNPTGTHIGRAELTRLAKGIPRSALLVIDAAYAEYARAADYVAGAALVEARDNVVMTRTFSKIYGLAALRLGWGYGPAHVVDALNRMRGPFNVSAPALAAGEAAVRDREYVEHCAIQNEVWRDWLTRELGRIGFSCTPSSGNFLLVKFGAEGPLSAPEADAWLRGRGVIARRMEGYGLPGHLRISVGSEKQNRVVVAALAALGAERG